MKYYCVANGRTKGIYLNWNDCKEQVIKYPNCKYKSFNDLENSKRYMELYCDEQEYFNYNLNEKQTSIKFFIK